MLPVAVMGAVLGGATTGSNHIVQTMLDGGMPALPNMCVPVVDVRDVAAAHVLAMEAPEAAGERFLLSAGPVMSFKEIATILNDGPGDSARR